MPSLVEQLQASAPELLEFNKILATFALTTVVKIVVLPVRRC